MKNKLFGSIIVLLITLASCEQSAPPPLPAEKKGDLHFSGYYWNIKNSYGSLVGPGPNNFSNSPSNVWLDADSLLHLKITKSNNAWSCSEVVSVKAMGYGTYVFTTASDLTAFNEKIVLGLFSWNDYSFQTQANSEIDIEFARWNNAYDSLLATYSVQPVWVDNNPPYTERTRRPPMQVSRLKSTCTHVFIWTPSLITWQMFAGDSYPGTEKLAEWTFNTSNPARSKIEGGQTSNAIVIPAPEDSTHARMNLWLFNGQSPSNNKEQEVVIKSFRYIPL